MGELQARYAYLATLLSRLFAHTGAVDPDQRKERMLDYCQVRDRWEQLNPTNPGVTMGWLDALGTSIKAKADKWGVTISFGPAEGPVIPNACTAGTMTPHDSIVDTLDDIAKTTASLLANVGKILPILVGLSLLSNMRGVFDFIGGGRRR